MMQQSMKDIGQAPQDDNLDYNYLTEENGIKIFYLVQQKQQQAVNQKAKMPPLKPSSAAGRKELAQSKEIEVNAANLLSDDDRKLWLSSKRNSNFPQTLIIDLTEAQFKQTDSKPLFFGSIGFRCWHAYTTNP